MTVYTYTNSQGEVISIRASGVTAARRAFGDLRQPGIQKRLPAGRVINKLQVVASPEGKWVEQVQDGKGGYVDTGARVSITYTHIASRSPVPQEDRTPDDMRIKAMFERGGMRGW